MTRSERFRENVSGWVLLAGAYGVAIVATIAVTLLVDRQRGEFAGIAILASVSTFIFWIFSFGTLFRHRRVWAPIALVIGTVIGTSVYLLTWLLWRTVEPSFRHAVPIELLPMFVLPVVAGVFAGAGLYFASLSQEVRN
jgi:phage shock protein PspC (stress-responsive transcriptional regulator)